MISQTMSQTILGLHSGCPGLLPILFNLALDHIWSHQQSPRPTLDVPDHDTIMLQTISKTNFGYPGPITNTVQSCSRPYMISQTIYVMWVFQTIVSMPSHCSRLSLGCHCTIKTPSFLSLVWACGHDNSCQSYKGKASLICMWVPVVSIPYTSHAVVYRHAILSLCLKYQLGMAVKHWIGKSIVGFRVHTSCQFRRWFRIWFGNKILGEVNHGKLNCFWIVEAPPEPLHFFESHFKPFSCWLYIYIFHGRCTYIDIVNLKFPLLCHDLWSWQGTQAFKHNHPHPTSDTLHLLSTSFPCQTWEIVLTRKIKRCLLNISQLWLQRPNLLQKQSMLGNSHQRQRQAHHMVGVNPISQIDLEANFESHCSELKVL